MRDSSMVASIACYVYENCMDGGFVMATDNCKNVVSLVVRDRKMSVESVSTDQALFYIE